MNNKDNFSKKSETSKMHDDIFNSEGINSLNFAMSKLMDEDYFYNIVYEAVMSYPSYVVVSSGKEERKLQIIGNMITFFEEKEDYEKCYDLLQIKKEIQNRC
jgi:hypothetical protein